MTAEKSRPEGTGRPLTQHTTTIPSAAPPTPADPPTAAGSLADEEILALIQRFPRVFHIWLNGYEAGLIGGRADQGLDDQQAAELAARIAVAQVENQADVRATVRHAAQFIDVHLAREKTRLANLNRPDSRRFRWELAARLGEALHTGGDTP